MTAADASWEAADPGWDNAPPPLDDPQWRAGQRENPLGAALTCTALAPTAPTTISPRPWAYGHFLLFGNAAVIGAVDGGGKGAIAVATMLAMITGKPLLNERVWRSGPVAIVTYEDDETEWTRRIAAACIHYGLDYDEVMPEIHFLQNPQGKITFAAMAGDRFTFPHGDEIIQHVKDIGAVMVLIDPFNHSHDFEDGNNNVLIAKVAGEMGRIARESNAAVLVLHHLRKGSNGTPDDLMGATSLRATFRSCRILSRMAPEVAEKMNISDPWRYIRIAGSKENYAPPPEKSSWFKLIGVPLGNATEEYPDGDDIGVATAWQSRPMFEGMDAETLSAVFAALRLSIHGPNKQSKHTPWAGKPLMDLGGRSEREAANILKAWIDSGVLVKGKYRTEDRNDVDKVAVDDLKAGAILAGISAAPAYPN